jgi:hypothetical protein
MKSVEFRTMSEEYRILETSSYLSKFNIMLNHSAGCSKTYPFS